MFGTAIATAVVGIHKVRIADKCDPATFNAALGEGACVASGGNVTFSEFFVALLSEGGHKAWRFISQPPRIKTEDTIEALNTGGEVHTFTEVAEFGGGFVPELNEPLGLEPVQECITPQVVDPTFVAAGASLEVLGLSPGPHRFQCCIHPWMRTEIDVR
jgi:hypothetical protein